MLNCPIVRFSALQTACWAEQQRSEEETEYPKRVDLSLKLLGLVAAQDTTQSCTAIVNFSVDMQNSKDHFMSPW